MVVNYDEEYIIDIVDTMQYTTMHDISNSIFIYNTLIIEEK